VPISLYPGTISFSHLAAQSEILCPLPANRCEVASSLSPAPLPVVRLRASFATWLSISSEKPGRDIDRGFPPYSSQAIS